MQDQLSDFLRHRFVRPLILVVGIAICVSIIWVAASFGFSRLFTMYSLTQASLPAAERAVELAPSDANAHVARAALMSLSGPASQSAAELEQAIALRPAHYYLWMNLGILRDQAQNPAAALLAFNESVRLAPFYAPPRWQRGNLLVRMGRYDEAFADLNQAARSNPELIPSLIDLAWGLSKGNVSLTEQLAQINTDVRRTAFARLLARQGKAQEALTQFRAAGSVKDEVKRELVEQLVSKKAFSEAFEIWRANTGSPGNEPATRPSIYDGGFEGPLSLDEIGFGWKVPRGLQAISMSLDSSRPDSGSKSLRIEFGGDSNPGSILLSQLILVEPSRHYRINFASRSQDIVTGGLPIAIVADASDRKSLGQSAPLSKGTSDWHVVSFEFTSNADTRAVVVSLQREACATTPCPIFGSISLDSFSIEQLK